MNRFALRRTIITPLMAGVTLAGLTLPSQAADRDGNMAFKCTATAQVAKVVANYFGPDGTVGNVYVAKGKQPKGGYLGTYMGSAPAGGSIVEFAFARSTNGDSQWKTATLKSGGVILAYGQFDLSLCKGANTVNKPANQWKLAG